MKRIERRQYDKQRNRAESPNRARRLGRKAAAEPGGKDAIELKDFCSFQALKATTAVWGRQAGWRAGLEAVAGRWPGEAAARIGLWVRRASGVGGRAFAARGRDLSEEASDWRCASSSAESSAIAKGFALARHSRHFFILLLSKWSDGGMPIPMQLSLTGKGLKRPGDKFGGSLLKGNPKGKRPLDSKLPVHLVLRARKSVLRLPRTFGPVEEIIRKTAEKYGVRIYQSANVGNHLHMVIQIKKLHLWAAFIRELTGRIAQRAGANAKNGFWLYRPFTRIIRSWKLAFRSALEYVKLNELEAQGHIDRKETRSLRELRQLFSTA